MNKYHFEKAKKIKEEIGKEKAEEICEYLRGITQTETNRCKIINMVRNKFKLSLEQSASCWHAWQIYAL